MIDLGDPVALAVTIRDAAGVAANATSVACTITLPDGSTTSPSVSNTATGVYQITYTPTLSGFHSVRWAATGTNACAFTDAFTVSDAGLAPLLTLAEAKAHLNITTTTNDDELREIVDVATAAAEQLTGRALTRRSVTETHDGDGGGTVLLRCRAALTVTSVTENGVTLTAGTDYRLRAGGLCLDRISGSSLRAWPSGVAAIVVVFATGVEGRDLALARQGVRELVRHIWATQRGARKASFAADEWDPGMGYTMPTRVVQLLEPLRIAGFA